MKKIRIGDAYDSTKKHKPNICIVCGKHPIVKTSQSIIGGLLVGFCKEHEDYTMILRAGNYKMGEAPFIWEPVDIKRRLNN